MNEDIYSFQQYLGSRFKTFLEAFEIFIACEGKTIVELGTSRSFVSGDFEGCMVNDPQFWYPNDPSKWDWGAGIFTRMCAMHLQDYHPDIHSVDINSDAIDISKVITEDYKELITYHHCSSEDFLNNFNGKIDLLYMDAGETNEGADKLHLLEAEIAVSGDLLSDNAVILIDDVNLPGEDNSKGALSIPFLKKSGFEVKAMDYQALLQKI